MRTSHSLGIALVASAAALGGCSGSPAPNVIIVQETPATGGQTSSGGAAPISFLGGAGAAGSTAPSGSGSGGGGASNGGAGTTATGDGGSAAASGVPCDVATYLAAKCTACHGNPPIPTALAGLVTYDDLKATSKEDPTKNEAELSVARMKNAASPMPPGALPAAADVAILEGWINAGYPMGSCGGGGGGDGGTVVPTPPSSVFKDAPAFATRAGPRAHNAGKDCMSCHQNGAGEAPQFSFGGTLYDASGKPVAGAEVRLVDTNGKATSVYTSTTGTFYSRGTGFAAPAQVGVRDATDSKDMISALASSGGGCTSCHCSGGSCTVAAIHLP